jgi:hypothetical protein
MQKSAPLRFTFPSCWLSGGLLSIMEVRFLSLPTLEKLRGHILQTLCAQDRLDPEQTPLYQAVIRGSGKPCGMFFQIQGPCRLQTYAVWAGQENRILFYDSTGQRFAESRLCEGPDPLELAAAHAQALAC